jgi:hypothetical protein
MRVTARRIRRAPLQEAFVFAKAGRLGCRVREDLEQYKHFLKHILTNREPCGAGQQAQSSGSSQSTFAVRVRSA